MIEIIEKPTRECLRCGCKFSFDKEDFKEHKWFLERKEYALNRFKAIYSVVASVDCPICGDNQSIYSYTEEKEDKK